MQITYCFYQAYIIFVKIYRYLILLKQNNPLNIRGLFVIATGFEPVTVCLEGRCSIQLSYATIKGHDVLKSGWQDSNLRPPRPKRGAITGLRYTPYLVISEIKSSNTTLCRGGRIRTCDLRVPNAAR